MRKRGAKREKDRGREGPREGEGHGNAFSVAAEIAMAQVGLRWAGGRERERDGGRMCERLSCRRREWLGETLLQTRYLSDQAQANKDGLRGKQLKCLEPRERRVFDDERSHRVGVG